METHLNQSPWYVLSVSLGRGPCPYLQQKRNTQNGCGSGAGRGSEKNTKKEVTLGHMHPWQWQNINFSTSEISLWLRIELQLCFNRGELDELGLEKLSALKMDHAVARYEVREEPKGTI